MELIKEAMCQICHKAFELDHEKIDLVNTLKNKGQSFIMVECPSCGSSTQYIEAKDRNLHIVNQDLPYRCPINHCSGWVAFINVEKSPFLGCGECGSIWHKEESFQNEIKNIIEIYQYRRDCYKKIRNKWYPTPISDEVINYEELVAMEPINVNDDFFRD